MRGVEPLSEEIVRWLVPWRELPWPVPWGTVFGREAPLAVEIGFGNGAFLAREARRRPERDHVGVELSWASATRLFRRLESGGLANARVLLADADVALGLLFERASLAELFVNHPCPWPKARHEERRLVRPEFLALAADRLGPGAALTIVTDHAAYADQVGALLEAEPALRSRHATSEVAAIPGREATKYERKALAAGIPIHYFEWERCGPPSSTPPQPLHSPLDAMPSLSLRGPHDPTTLLTGFPGASVHEPAGGLDVFVRLGTAWRRTDGEHWLVEALAIEGKLRQDFGLEVVARAPGRLLVKLSPLGRPHPTHGVKRAVWLLGEWLRERHPGLAVEHENLGRAKGAPPGAE